MLLAPTFFLESVTSLTEDKRGIQEIPCGAGKRRSGEKLIIFVILHGSFRILGIPGFPKIGQLGGKAVGYVKLRI